MANSFRCMDTTNDGYTNANASRPRDVAPRKHSPKCSHDSSSREARASSRDGVFRMYFTREALSMVQNIMLSVGCLYTIYLQSKLVSRRAALSSLSNSIQSAYREEARRRNWFYRILACDYCGLFYLSILGKMVELQGFEGPTSRIVSRTCENDNSDSLMNMRGRHLG